MGAPAYAWERDGIGRESINVWRAKQWMTEDACVTSACIKQGDDYAWLMMLLLGELPIQYADNELEQGTNETGQWMRQLTERVDRSSVGELCRVR